MIFDRNIVVTLYMTNINIEFTYVKINYAENTKYINKNAHPK